MKPQKLILTAFVILSFLAVLVVGYMLTRLFYV